MSHKYINHLILYGILIFCVGFFLGIMWIRYLQLLIPVGSLMTLTGTIFYVKQTNLVEEFKKDEDEDILTYFWNTIVLKLWTIIFLLWMLFTNLGLLAMGFF